MADLQYDIASLPWFMAMTGSRVCFLCEGSHDRPFYRKLLAAALPGVPIDIKTASELFPGSSNRKSTVIKIMKVLERRGVMNAVYDKDKRVQFVALLDKDVDPEVGVQSPEIDAVYTTGYSHENYLFECADIAAAVGAVCGIGADITSASALGSQHPWVRQNASCWLCWAAVCLVSRRAGVDSFKNYSVASPLNSRARSAVDEQVFRKHVDALARDMRVLPSTVRTLLEAAMHEIVSSIGDDAPGRFFPGEWHLHFVEDDLRTCCGDMAIAYGDLPQRLLSLLVERLDAEHPRLRTWRDQVRAMIA